MAPDPSPAVAQPSHSRRYHLFRAAAWVAARLPRTTAVPAARLLAMAKAVLPGAGPERRLVARHQERARGVALSGGARRRAVRDTYASYGRYWVESLRLPHMSPAAVDAAFTIDGLEHIRAARQAGTGAILALPHVGGWEVGGSWFVRQGFPLTVVVEALEPADVFEWFVDLRRGLGFTVVPLGKQAAIAVVRALRANQCVALLSDRDLAGGGVGVDLFGERTTLPAGPATLAKRLKAPLLPTAVYFRGAGHHAVVRPPVPLDGDVATVTQAMAGELESLIRAAPEQWHLFQPNWPSDRASPR